MKKSTKKDLEFYSKGMDFFSGRAVPKRTQWYGGAFQQSIVAGAISKREKEKAAEAAKVAAVEEKKRKAARSRAASTAASSTTPQTAPVDADHNQAATSGQARILAKPAVKNMEPSWQRDIRETFNMIQAVFGGLMLIGILYWTGLILYAVGAIFWRLFVK
jgi:hypothetical protein